MKKTDNIFSIHTGEHWKTFHNVVLCLRAVWDTCTCENVAGGKMLKLRCSTLLVGARLERSCLNTMYYISMSVFDRCRFRFTEHIKKKKKTQ